MMSVLPASFSSSIFATTRPTLSSTE